MANTVPSLKSCNHQLSFNCADGHADINAAVISVRMPLPTLRLLPV